MGSGLRGCCNPVAERRPLLLPLTQLLRLHRAHSERVFVFGPRARCPSRRERSPSIPPFLHPGCLQQQERPMQRPRRHLCATLTPAAAQTPSMRHTHPCSGPDAVYAPHAPLQRPKRCLCSTLAFSLILSR